MRSCSATAVVGLQWGDEGKGKIVDFLTSQHDVIVRYNGGANAGHTVVIGEETYALHLIPSGILSPGTTCVIANGVVIDPVTLLHEIDHLRDRGIEVGDNLLVSDRAHVVMPYHKEHDAALESWLAASLEKGRGEGSIGTTRRGIGPAYADKVHRSSALRMGDLLDEQRLHDRLGSICALRSVELSALGIKASPLEAATLAGEYAAMGRRLRSHITDTTYALHDLAGGGQRLLFEGANACLLDIDHGTFPFVTSSNCSTLGIPAGTGLPGTCIERVVGTMKAYTTRVGSGPFPTEEMGSIGDLIRDRGREYGTTTGRPRRCGWLDLVAVRYSTMLCGVTSLACMLLDVLSGFDELKLCTGYRLEDGSVSDRFIPDAHRLTRVTPVLETVPGWDEPIEETSRRVDLPEGARAYLDRIEAFVDLPIEFVSVGPERTQTLVGSSP